MWLIVLIFFAIFYSTFGISITIFVILTKMKKIPVDGGTAYVFTSMFIGFAVACLYMIYKIIKYYFF